MPFEFLPTTLPDVIQVKSRLFSDDRGSFTETYKQSDFFKAGIDHTFVQDNHSVSTAGTLRGLHYQLPPHAQGKLVRVVAGRAWDVAVDLRRSSVTFAQWIGIELNAADSTMLWIPLGFAHGFLALEDQTHLIYKCTAEYDRGSERSIRWDDPDLAIDWPILPSGAEYRLSEKDSIAPLLPASEVFP